MTPPILKELFDQWRKENKSFCVTSENFNKTDVFAKDGETFGVFGYPFAQNLIEGKEEWEEWSECHNYEGIPPMFLPQKQIEEIAAWLSQKRQLSTITLHLTYKCNYTCPMCPFHGEGYEGKYFEDNADLKTERTLEEAKAIIDKVVDYGIRHISLTSQGEVLLYPHLCDVIAYCKSKGMYVALTSNGALIDEMMAKKLKQVGLDAIDISIDSMDEEIYKQVRSTNANYYQKAIQAPILTKKEGIYTSVQFVTQQENQGGFADVLKYYRPFEINQIRNSFQCEVSQDGNVTQVDGGIQRLPYVHNLCGSNEYMILLDGTLIGCCAMMYFYRHRKEKLPNVLEDDDFAQSVAKLNEFMVHDSFMLDKCQQCEMYGPNVFSVQEKRIENGYLVISGSRIGGEIWFRVPEALQSLPDKILLFMYENQMVAKIKNANLL